MRGGWQTSPRQCYAETSQGGISATLYTNFSSSIQKSTLSSICGEKHRLKAPRPGTHALAKSRSGRRAKSASFSIKILQYLRVCMSHRVGIQRHTMQGVKRIALQRVPHGIEAKHGVECGAGFSHAKRRGMQPSSPGPVNHALVRPPCVTTAAHGAA